MKQIELAWLAGIMEGEGTFAIYHQRSSNRDQLKATISLTNTDPFLIKKAVEIFRRIGVELHIRSYDNKKGSTRTVYDISTAKQTNVKKICEELIPYLVGEKLPKAHMLLEFVNKRIENGKSQYDDEDWTAFHNVRSSTTTREASLP